MKRVSKSLAAACVTALALAAMAAASASASVFTVSETGEFVGSQTSNQVYTPGSFGSVTCKKAHLTGVIVSVSFETLEVTVNYSECTGFGFPAEFSTAKYRLHANGELDIVNTITIKVPSLGCVNTIGPQSGLKSISYTNSSGKLGVSFSVTGIVSSGSGTCAGGNNGTLTGSFLVERVGGGTLAWDA